MAATKVLFIGGTGIISSAASALAAEEMIPVPPMNNTFVAAMHRLYRRVRQGAPNR